MVPNRQRPHEDPLFDDDPFILAKNQGPSLAELNRMDDDDEEEMFETLSVDLGGPQSVSTSASDDGSLGSLGNYGDSMFGGMDDFNSMSMGAMFDASSLY